MAGSIYVAQNDKGGRVVAESAMVGACGALVAGTAKASGWLTLSKGVAVGAGLLAASPVGLGMALGVGAAFLYGANSIRTKRILPSKRH